MQGIIDDRKVKATRWRMLKERIRQFSIWYSEEEDQREKERFKLRLARLQNKEEMVASHHIILLRILYGFVIIVAFSGGLFLFCSTVESIGKHTAFFKRKVLYRILGSCVLVLALVLLLVATGLKHKLRTRHSKPRTNFYILDKSKKSQTNMSNGQLQATDSIESADSGTVEDIEMTTLRTESRAQIFLPRENDVSDAPLLACASSLDDSASKDAYLIDEHCEHGKNTERARANRAAWAKTRWFREAAGAQEHDDNDLNGAHTEEQTHAYGPYFQ